MMATGNMVAEILVKISLSELLGFFHLLFYHAVNLGRTFNNALNPYCLISNHLIDAQASLDEC